MRPFPKAPETALDEFAHGKLLEVPELSLDSPGGARLQLMVETVLETLTATDSPGDEAAGSPDTA
jgi:hypothetical protein